MLLFLGFVLGLAALLIFFTFSSSSFVLGGFFPFISLLVSIYCFHRYFTSDNAALLTLFEYGTNERTYYGTNEEINTKFNQLANSLSCISKG